MGRTIDTSPVALSSTLKLTLKRGALVAAANWPLTIVQAVADSLFKLLIAAPLFGGIFLVALVVGAEPGTLLSLEWRDLATTIASSLLSKPVVLLAWVAALGVVIAGGSLFVFLIKGGAVSIMVRGERNAGPIELPPLLPDVVAQASAYSADAFIEGANALFPAYARLGLVLMTIYLASGLGFLTVVAAIRNAGEGWGLTALVTAVFVAWITLINFVYLLTQIVIASDGCAVATAIPRAVAFIRRERRTVGGVFPCRACAGALCDGRIRFGDNGLRPDCVRAALRIRFHSSQPPGMGAARRGFPVHWAVLHRRVSQALSRSESRPR
jgi:hypothetical protein